MIFAIKNEGKSKMLELDFIESLLIVKTKDKLVKKHHLKMVKRIIPSFKYDEFLIEFRDEHKGMIC